MRVIAHKTATVYDTTTRSRLEARWAIFFRELGLNWKYEPTTLRAGRYSYTPDFEIESFGYVEIKPTLALFIAESEKRVAHITAANPQLSIYVFCADTVSLGRVALYRGNKIFAPTYSQMCIALTRARAIRIPATIHDAYIRRAEVIANKTRFNEWQTAREILVEVIAGFERNPSLSQLKRG